MDLAQMLEACLDPNSEVRNGYVYALSERRWRPFQQQHDCASTASLPNAIRVHQSAQCAS